MNETWQQSQVLKCNFNLNFGESVPRKSIVVTTSAKSISANLQDKLLKVVIETPDVGPIIGHVAVSFAHLKGNYSLKIPIKGNVLPPLNVSPKFINFGEMPREQPMIGEVLLEGIDGDLEKPDVVVDGDWKIQSLERETEQSWKLHVCTKVLEGKENRYGNILVKGKWIGKPINIPLTGSFRKP